MSIISLEQARDQLDIDPGDGSVNAELQAYIFGITKVVENYLHEVVEVRAVVERVTMPWRFDWRYGARFRLWSVPVISVTSIVSLDGTTSYPVDQLDITGDTGMVEVIAGQAPAGRCKVTYQAGYASVPYNYQQGALVILQHVWETQRGAGEARGFVPGVVGQEEQIRSMLAFTFPRKAREWLGDPRPVVG